MYDMRRHAEMVIGMDHVVGGLIDLALAWFCCGVLLLSTPYDQVTRL